MARIEEVNRILEVLASVGVRWLTGTNDLQLIPPAELDLEHMDEAAARRTRTIIMFLGPLLHQYTSLPAAVRRRVRPGGPAPSNPTSARCARLV